MVEVEHKNFPYYLVHLKLARKADISYNTIIKLESKGITDPRMETLIKLAKALEVSIDQLVT